MIPRIRALSVGMMLLVSALGVAVVACSGVDVEAVCESNDDCFENYACDLAVSGQCLRRCETDASCLKGQVCDIPEGATEGVCRRESTDDTTTQ